MVLLVAVRRGSLSYRALYCEHHEDFLGERADGLFDGYQVKTSRPENGAWTLTSAALTKSIGRFVDLMRAYPAQMGYFYFVSNSEIDAITSDSKDQVRRGRCPGLMVQHVRGCATASDIEEPYLKAFDKLVAEIGATSVQVFDVLRRLIFVKGPSREEFDASLAQEHLGSLSECVNLTPSELASVRDTLVAKFHRAASIHVTDPNRHIGDFLAGGSDAPSLVAKKIICADVEIAPAATSTKMVVFQGEPMIRLDGTRPKGILEQKLTQGGIAESVEYMKARERAAEYHFLEEQVRNPRTAGHQLRQVEEAVHGECIEAFMSARKPDLPFGQAMFQDVTSRLRRLETDRADLLGGEPYEVLVGTAALLTSECRVWWSDRFTVLGGRS